MLARLVVVSSSTPVLFVYTLVGLWAQDEANIRIRDDSIAVRLEAAISPFPLPIRVILVIRDPHNEGRRSLNRKIM
jgi:hypothetical protein